MIDVEQRDRVTLIRLNRPERHNAVDGEACEALATAVLAASGGGARVIVLAGRGTNFCAGADLTGVEDAAFAEHLRAALQSLRDVPIVTMAAVHGAALGAGTQLAIACDLRVAAPDSRFGIPAAKLGLMVDQWTVERVAAIAGHGPARAILLAAEEITANAAVGLGLVSRLGDVDDALVWAEQISALAPLTIAGHKLALNRSETGHEDEDVAVAFRAAWGSADLREGRTAFAEKRSPRFEGK